LRLDYQLQDRGLDTVDANKHLGFEPGERSYPAPAVTLRHPRFDLLSSSTTSPRSDTLRRRFAIG
jgi:3,4-dihydroxy 2-butanone 4-phosphate synthase/GTP cyclohydrolase II